MKTLLLILMMCLVPAEVFSQELVKGHYCYTCGEGESIQEARELTKTLAIRQAIESSKAFSEAFGPSRDSRLSNDIIQMISSGYMVDLKVIDHSEQGRTICETIQATVSPEELAEVIRRELAKRDRPIEEAGIDSNGCLKILRIAKQVDRYGGRAMAVVKVLRPTGPLHLPSLQNKKPCFKVIVDTFDPEGLPLGSEYKFIHESEVEMSPGEMKALFFSLPRNAKAFRAWLVGGTQDPDRDAAKKPLRVKRKAEPVSAKTEQPSSQAQAGHRSLKGIEAKESEGELIVEILADGPVERYRKLFMESPPRFVIDLDEEWRGPDFSVRDVKGKMLRRIRIGRHPAKLRIVLDLEDGKRFTSALIRPSTGGLTIILKQD
jgi:hypothetical protein